MAKNILIVDDAAFMRMMIRIFYPRMVILLPQKLKMAR